MVYYLALLIVIKFQLKFRRKNAENKLNDTDWKILKLICVTPTITNKDIGEKVYLSVDGVKSSFKKMYDLFDITSIGRNKKISLAIKVIKLSEE